MTVSIIPHGGKPPRQYEIAGARLLLLRAGIASIILLVAAAIVIVATGGSPLPGPDSQEARIDLLEDSLARMGAVETRLDSIEAVLEEIRTVRRRIEGISELADPSGVGDP